MAGFKPNRQFVEQLQRDRHVQVVLEDRAEDALKAAQAIAREHRDTGAYEESLYVEGNTLGTTDFAGHIIEWGGASSPPLAPLRKAAEQVGAKVVDRG